MRFVKNFATRFARSISALILLSSQAVPMFFPATANATWPNPNEVSYWCSDDDGGVKFNTGAVGTHVNGPITITIVDNGKTELSNASGTGVVITQIVIKGGNYGGNGGNGNESYIPPFSFPLKAPNNYGGNQADISHVIVCYDNSPTSIKVVKDAKPDDGQNFDFFLDKVGSSGSDDSFELDDDGTEIIVKSSKTFNNLSPATYVITEQNIPSGWKLEDILCTGGANVTEDLANNKVTIVLSTGEAVVCTFTNKTVGKITVNKKVDADGNGHYEGANPTANNLGFDWGLDSEVPARDMGTYAVNVPTGNHTINENTVSGFTFTGWYYTDQEDNSGVHQVNCKFPQGTTIPVSVNVTKNSHSKITLCNQKTPNGEIRVIKEVINNDGGNGVASDFQLKINGENKAQNQYHEYPAGTYTVSEDNLAGYAQVSITCKDDDTHQVISHPVNLAPNQSVTCKVKNNDLAPGLTVIKNVTNDHQGQLEADDFTLRLNGTALVNPVLSNGDLTAIYTPSVLANQQYVVTEDFVFGYEGSRVNCTDNQTGFAVAHPVTLNEGQHVTCVITNDDKPGKLIIVKDLVNDDGGAAEESDFGYCVTVHSTGLTAVDLLNSQACVSEGALSSQPIEIELPNGTYDITEVLGDLDKLYDVIYENCQQVYVGNGQTVTCTIKNNDKKPKLTLIKNILPNGAAEADDFTPTVNGINSAWGEHIVDTGAYTVSEVSVEGWKLNGVSCYVTGSPATGVSHPVELETGDDITCEVTNEQLGKVVVTKFHDKNENGKWDEGEPALPGFEINLDSSKLVSDANGEAIFENVPSGDYELSETLQDGWEVTNIYCENKDLYDLLSQVRSENSDSYYVSLEAGETAYCFVGNAQDPALVLEKTNNVWPTPVTRGSTVVYTLTVTVPENNGRVYGTEGEEVTVVDLLPEHFAYVAGTWTASSSVRGDLKAAGITLEPNYGGPGPAYWQLTDGDYLEPGEVITLTYAAKVGENVAAGEYDNIAFAFGFNRGGEKLFANSEEDPFVSSTVAVSVFTPQVLGESTTLVNTGSSIVWQIGAAFTALAAAILVALKKPKKTLVIALISVLTLGVMGSSQAFAATATSVRIQKLKTPGTEANFTIDYQVLTVAEECEFEVDLMQNGSVVASETVTAMNGDSGDFAVTLPADGDYEFQVTAESASEGCDSGVSEVVSYKLDRSSLNANAFSTTQQSASNQQASGLSSATTNESAAVGGASDDESNDSTDEQGQNETSEDSSEDGTNPWWIVLGLLVVGGGLYGYQRWQATKNEK